MLIPKGHLMKSFVLVFLLAIAVLAGAARATAPGHNGSIAFRRYFDLQQTRGAVFTIAPDGSHARQVTHPVGGAFDDQPAWAPNGRMLTFTRCAGVGGLCHVWTVAPDGS